MQNLRDVLIVARLSVVVSTYKSTIVQFVSQVFIDRFGRDPRRLQLLFLSQGFSNRALIPLGGHGAVLWGPRAEAEQGPRAEAKTRYFY